MPLQDMGSCTADGVPCTLYAKLQHINSILLLRTDYYFTENPFTSRHVGFATQTHQHRPPPSLKILAWVQGILRNHMCVQTVAIHLPLPPSLAHVVFSHMWWITEAMLADDHHLGYRCNWRALRRLHLQTGSRPNNRILLTTTEHVTVFNENVVVGELASAVAKTVETSYISAMSLEGNTHVERLTVVCERDVHADFGAVRRLLESLSALKEVYWMFRMSELSTYDHVAKIVDASCLTVPRVMLLIIPPLTAKCPLSDTSSIAVVQRAIAYPNIVRIKMGATDADLTECGVLPPRPDGDSDAEGSRQAGNEYANVLSSYVNRYLNELCLIDVNGIDCRFRTLHRHPQDSRCCLYRMGRDDIGLGDLLDFTRCPSLVVLRITCVRCDNNCPEHYSNFFHLASTYLRSSNCTIRDLRVHFCATCNRQAYGDMIDALCVNKSVTQFACNLPIRTQEQCQKFARMVRLNKTLVKFKWFHVAPGEGESVDKKCVLNALRDHNFTLTEMAIPPPFTDRHHIKMAAYLDRNNCIVNRAADLISEARGAEMSDQDLKVIALVPREKLSARVGAEAAASCYNDIAKKYFRLTNVSSAELFQNSDEWRCVFSYLGIQDVDGVEFVI